MELDKLDKRILWILDNDARIHTAELARRTKITRQVAAYRLNRLVGEGIITGFISCVDIHRLGYLTYRVYLRFHRLQPEKTDAVLAYLVQHQHTLWVVATKGAWDAEAVFVCRNYIHFNNILKDFLASFEPSITQYNISMSPVSYHFKRDYLVQGQRKDFSPTYYGFEPGDRTWSKSDLAILGALSKDCRASYAELAEAADLTPQTVKVRLEELEKERIIPTHRILLDLAKLGRRYVKLLVKLRGLTKQLEGRIYSFCAKRNYVIYLTEVLGSWQVEIETEIENDAELAQLSSELSESFAKNVVDVEVLEVSKELKMDYFPFSAAAAK